MQIQHSKLKQAIEIGCYISMVGDRRVRIFWPQRSVELFGPSVNDVFDEMKAVQSIVALDPEYKIITNGELRVVITDDAGLQMVGTPALPTEILGWIEANEDEWDKAPNGRPEGYHEDELHIRGVPKSGALAYKEGVPAGDCPYLEGSPEFSTWNDEWDQAAEDEMAAEQKPEGVGSVVTNRYRAAYSEQGHPTHCGDELAILLNNICSNKAGTNLELFEAICAANGISLTRYNRTTKGWQGRLRMTGRNLLAKKVRENGGVLKMPENIWPNEHRLGQDWLIQAGLKFKPKTGQV